METTGLRVLSQSSTASSSATQSSSSSLSSSSSIPLSSSSIPYTPPTSSSFNFPAPPTAHNIPSYPPPACPPLPSISLLNSSSARAFSLNRGWLKEKIAVVSRGSDRYLVKKYKVLGGGAGVGPRGPRSSMGSASGTLGGSSLFVLDTMRAACLLEKGPNLQGDALKAAMSIINDILRGKEDAAQALTDSIGNGGAIRDFVWKQAEILRGRGGVLSNSTGGSMGAVR